MPVRNLPVTEQTWKDDFDTGAMVRARLYNSPNETGKGLDAQQGKVNLSAVLGFHGTCGLVSCVNILRLAGREDTTEEELVAFAANYDLCRVSMNPDDSGGTNAAQRQCILRYFGLDSWLEFPSVECIAKYVSEGRGVIISVDAGKLWQDSRFLNGLHAIVVTSVKTDLEGNLLGFYICDSGSGNNDCARYCTVDFLKAAMTTRPMNVTTAIIR